LERKRVGIVLFEDIEVLDFCGPFEVFSAARLNEEKRREEPSPFEVWLVAEYPEPVTTTGNMKVIPHYTFESIILRQNGCNLFNNGKYPSNQDGRHAGWGQWSQYSRSKKTRILFGSGGSRKRSRPRLVAMPIP